MAVLLAVAAVAARADEHAVLFEGLGTRLEAVKDAMTDQRTCQLQVNGGSVYLSFRGNDQLAVWPNRGDILFARSGEHMLRAGELKPVRLRRSESTNSLVAADPKEVPGLAKALAVNRRATIRLFKWPANTYVDTDLRAVPFAHAWDVAAQKCGWRPLGVQAELPPATLVPKLPLVFIEGTTDLTLVDRGGCFVQVRTNATVGGREGQARWDDTVWATTRSTHLVVRDPDGHVLFDQPLPATREAARDPRLALEASKALWSAGPLGSVFVGDPSSGTDTQLPPVLLYGFRELWTWGVKNCGLPPVGEDPPPRQGTDDR